MADYLFPHFLSDPREYKQAESLWSERWDELLRRVGQECLWAAPWANSCFVDGTSMQDGNPIFSAISLRRKLAIRVIQLEPRDDPREFSAWTDTFGEGLPDPVKELVISCVLTPETLNEAVELMQQWISEERLQHPPESHNGPISPDSSGTLPSTVLSDTSPPSST